MPQFTPNSVWEQFAEEATGTNITDRYTVDQLRSVRSKRDSQQQLRQGDWQSGGRGFNINEFRGFRDNAGILKVHDYHIVITWPAVLMRTQEFLHVNRNLELTCDTINFPNVGALTYNVQHYGYGAIEAFPTTPKFTPLQAMFVCDRRSQIHKYFHAWVKAIVNYDFGQSINSPSSTLATGSAYPYELSYKIAYASDLYLHIYDQSGNEVRQVMFRQAYPTDVADIQLAWSKPDYIKVPVQFAFTDMQDVTL